MLRRLTLIAGVLAALSCAADVRVGVFGLFRPERVVVRPGLGVALKVTAGRRSFVLYENQRLGLRAEGSEVDVFAHREQSAAATVHVSGRDGGPADLIVAMPGKIERSFRGVLDIRAAAGQLGLVVSMDLETAVAAAVAAEVPEGWPSEALKAIAVVARSYYVAGGRRHGEFDFCDTTHCQFHRSPAREASPPAQAVRATRGLVLEVDGRPKAVMYSASCGGKTKPADGYSAVNCATCLREAPVWERRLPFASAGRLLTSRSEEERVQVVRTLGWNAVPGNNYEIRRDGAWVLLNGRGEGHGIGLCQLGASGMASAGSGFQEILRHYLPGAIIGAQKDSSGGQTYR